MPVDKELLEILCCPVTKVPVVLASDEQIQELNRRIESGELKYADGSPVEEKLEEGLITEDGKTLYRVDDSIPDMLSERGIPLAATPDE